MSIEVHLPAISQDEIANGKKGFVMAAMLTYNDGFPNTPDQPYFLCDQSSYAPDTKLFVMRPCDDLQLMLSLLAKADEYPSDKYEEK